MPAAAVFSGPGKNYNTGFRHNCLKESVLTNLFLLIYQLYMGEYTEAVHTLECARYNLV
jgi:hypothetical protein